MEGIQCSRDLLNSIVNKINSMNKIDQQTRQSFIELNEKLNEDNSQQKINLVLFGNVSVGKTTLINLIIRHLITQRTNRVDEIDVIQEFLNEEEEEEYKMIGEKYDGYVRMPVKEIENGYFYCFIENSDSGAYEIIIEVNNDEERETLLRLKELKNKHFDKNNQMTFKYSDNRDEIRSMNKFLEEIDYACYSLIRKQKHIDLNSNVLNPDKFSPSKMTIKIPNFPKEFRLIDSPGLSIRSFKKGLIKIINELNYINFFIYVNDIQSKESYSSSDDFLRELSYEYDSLFLYSFITKGNKFLKKFPRIDEWYKEYVRINNIKFRNLEELKTKINIRKIIPINDEYYNEDVKYCLNVFFNDLNHITKEYIIPNNEASNMKKIRSLIFKMPSNEKLLNQMTEPSVFLKWGNFLSTLFYKFISSPRNIPATNYKEEFLSIINNKRLKNFFIKVFNYQEENHNCFSC